jgi:hypothetical protein
MCECIVELQENVKNGLHENILFLQVVRALCSLLKKQAWLRSADLSYCLMDREEGSRVLDALTYGTRFKSKEHLVHVDLRQFFSPATRTVSLVRYSKVVTQFTALVSLRIDLVRTGSTGQDRPGKNRQHWSG